MDNDTESREIRLQGISASPGICIGKAYLVDTEGVDVVNAYYVAKEDLPNEKKRFKTAVQKAKDELATIINNTPEEYRQHSRILETHMVLLKDKMLFNRTLDTIEAEAINAEWALKKVVSRIKRAFKDMENAYIRERANDITQLSERIMRNLIGVEGVKIADIRKRVVLVAQDLSPAETSQIRLERVNGFVTDRGGKASHTSIIARALEIPAVQGLKNVTSFVQNDDIIIVDGTAGLVIIDPSEQTLLEFEERKLRYEAQKAAMNRTSHDRAVTRDGEMIQVMGNIELPEEVMAVHGYGGDGIGLYRTEFQYLSQETFPTEEALLERYRDVVGVMGPRPVTIRTLDINGDKALAKNHELPEENPALGLRAIRYCLQKPEVFTTQLRAILRAAAAGRVRLLLPLISSIEEVIETKALIDKAARELEDKGQRYNRDIELGIMIEVPSAVIMADAMAEEVDFFSIGTNDLVQYSMAIDRGNRDVAHLFQPLHPALLRMIKQVTDVGRRHGIPVFMCGEMAGDPLNVPILLGLGISELSMNPQAIPVVKSMLRLISAEESRAFAEQILPLTRVKDVVQKIEEAYGDMVHSQIYGIEP